MSEYADESDEELFRQLLYGGARRMDRQSAEVLEEPQRLADDDETTGKIAAGLRFVDSPPPQQTAASRPDRVSRRKTDTVDRLVDEPPEDDSDPPSTWTRNGRPVSAREWVVFRDERRN